MWIDLQEKQLRQKLGEIKEPSFYRKEEETAEARTFEEMAEWKGEQKTTSVYAGLTFDEVVEWREGTPMLKKQWQKRLEKEREELYAAEQYALLANENRRYPCLKCQKPEVYLFENEVWKYGVTKKGQAGRYTDEYLLEMKLSYHVQKRGTILECLEEEKLKIFNYPLLPENLARTEQERLARPPGNLRTD